MPIQKFEELAQYAKKCGINTLGELREYKRANNITTNDDLFRRLFYDALRIDRLR